MEQAVEYPKFRWYVLFAVLVTTVATSVVMISPSPLVGEVTKTLHIDVGTVSGAILATFQFAMAFGAFFLGIVLDRIGIVKMFVISLVVITIACLLVPTVGQDLGYLVVLRLLMGLGTGPIVGGQAKVAADWFPRNERPLVAGVLGLGVSLGVAIGFIFAPRIFAATASWYAALAWGAAWCIAGIILMLIVSVKKPPVVATEEKAAGAGGGAGFKQIMSLPVTWTVILSVIALNWIFSAFNDLTPGYFAVPAPLGLGHGPVVAGNVMTLYQLAFMVGSLISGFLVMQLFKGRERPVVFIGFLLTAIFSFSVGIPAIAAGMGVLVTCLIIAGLFMGMPNAVVFAFIARHFPENVTGSVGGLAMGLGVLCGSLGVALGALFVHNTGSYHLSIIVVSVIAILGLLNSIRLIPSKRLEALSDSGGTQAA